MFSAQRLIASSALALLAFVEPSQIEFRSGRGGDAWITTNHYRLRVESKAQAHTPILASAELPADFSPNSLRVVEAESGRILPAKLEWRPPRARIAWRATGARAYYVYFDREGHGETERLPEPTMIGAGDRVTYGRAGVRGELAVGLWPAAVAFDYDLDGTTDVIVGCPDVLYSGTYLFRNIGTNARPLFNPAQWIGPATRELVAADFNADGALDLVANRGYFSDVRRRGMSCFVPIELPRDYHVGSSDLWHPVDWDADGNIDLLVGTND